MESVLLWTLVKAMLLALLMFFGMGEIPSEVPSSSSIQVNQWVSQAA